jgi:hypothetical protein
MGKSKKPIELTSSDKILEHPAGDIDDKVLEEILIEAHYAAILSGQRILLTKEKRVKGFNPSNPNWEERQYNMTHKKLKMLYKDIFGKDFKPPEISQQEYEDRKWASFARTARRGY